MSANFPSVDFSRVRVFLFSKRPSCSFGFMTSYPWRHLHGVSNICIYIYTYIYIHVYTCIYVYQYSTRHSPRILTLIQITHEKNKDQRASNHNNGQWSTRERVDRNLPPPPSFPSPPHSPPSFPSPPHSPPHMYCKHIFFFFPLPHFLCFLSCTPAHTHTHTHAHTHSCTHTHTHIHTYTHTVCVYIRYGDIYIYIQMHI